MCVSMYVSFVLSAICECVSHLSCLPFVSLSLLLWLVLCFCDYTLPCLCILCLPFRRGPVVAICVSFVCCVCHFAICVSFVCCVCHLSGRQSDEPSATVLQHQGVVAVVYEVDWFVDFLAVW